MTAVGTGKAGRRHTVRARSKLRRRLLVWSATAGLTLVCLVWIYPFLWMVSASLKDQFQVFQAGLSLLPRQPQWSNYARAWTGAQFGTYMVNTVFLTVVTVALVIVRCATAGYVIARYHFIGKKVVVGVLVATLIVPEGYTIIPIVELTQNLGLLNTRWGLVLAMTGLGHIPATLLYVGYFRKVPKEMEEAAVIDGAGFLRIFFRIMLPMSAPITATVAVLTFLHAWNAFFLPLVFTFSRPELRTLAVGMRAFVGENATDWVGMAAAATISVVPVVIFFLLVQRFFFEGIAGAVKS